MPTYVRPGVQVNQASGAAVGPTNASGAVIAIAGSAPFGPASPVLISNLVDGQAMFGNDAVYNDINGWNIPVALRFIFRNSRGNTPQVLVQRSGVTQASILLVNGTGPTGAFTATLLPQTLGGSSGNGLTLVYNATTPGTFTITPPAASGLNAEVYNSVGTTATWATIQARVNGISQLVTISLSGTDSGALAGTTTNTTAGGTDGQYPTMSQINTAITSLTTISYRKQPIQYIVPLFADTGTTAATTAVGNALAAAITMQSVGINQRAQAIGCVAPGASISGGITNAQTLETSLNAALDNAGDSGHCTLWANWYPYAFDSATSQERLYPAWTVPCAYAGACASLIASVPKGRITLREFTRLAEQFTLTNQNTLLGSGIMVADDLGRLIDQVTCANLTSYRRQQSVQAQEDMWVGDLVFSLDSYVESLTQGANSLATVSSFAKTKVIAYQELLWMAAASISASISTSNATVLVVNVPWIPILPFTNIQLNTQLIVPTGSVQTNILST